MTATANGTHSAPPSPRPFVTPADLVAHARAAAEHDRRRQKERRDGWLAAQHQIATVLAAGASDCLAMEAEALAAAAECERLLGAYAPDLARAIADLAPPAWRHQMAPPQGARVWKGWEILGARVEVADDEDDLDAARLSRSLDPAACAALVLLGEARDPRRPAPRPADTEPPRPSTEGGERCPACGGSGFTGAVECPCCEGTGLAPDPGPAQTPPDAENVTGTVSEGPVATRLMFCPECHTPERVPAVVLVEICGVCALAGKTVPLSEGPPPPKPPKHEQKKPRRRSAPESRPTAAAWVGPGQSAPAKRDS